MIFDEVFLQSQNDDCLGQVFSFLTCQDLANAGRTCKVLNRTIFEAEEANVNLIWQGAEEALTNPSDLIRNLSRTVRIKKPRLGAHAREHCYLFAVASKAAKAYERMDGIEENRIKVDGVLADLMNVRGFDAESIAEKKAMGAANTQTLEEAANEVVIMSREERREAEQSEEAKQRARAKRLKAREEWEKLAALKAPKKAYHHVPFVRITSRATGEMISEGFCRWYQKLPWFEGLYPSRECLHRSQGIHIGLDFESLIQSEEMQNFIGALSAPRPTLDIMHEQGGFGINMTAVVINRRNDAVRCLFQHDLMEATQSRKRSSRFGCGVVRNMPRYEFLAQPRWGLDSVQLGPSISQDSYFLQFSLSLGVAKGKKNGGRIVVPLLEVDVEQDRSAFRLAVARHREETRVGG